MRKQYHFILSQMRSHTSESQIKECHIIFVHIFLSFSYFPAVINHRFAKFPNSKKTRILWPVSMIGHEFARFPKWKTWGLWPLSIIGHGVVIGYTRDQSKIIWSVTSEILWTLWSFTLWSMCIPPTTLKVF